MYAFYQAQANVRGGFTAAKGREAELRAGRNIVVVPPNHILVFNELLTHEVMKSVNTEAFNYRCYLKWFVSESHRPYWPPQRLDEFFNRQTQIGMSLSQPDAPIFASAHSSYPKQAEMLEKFSERVIPQLRTFEIKGEKLKKSNLSQRFMGKDKNSEARKGLVDWGLGFAPYTDREKSPYIPTRFN
jgi:hypothetical protein